MSLATAYLDLNSDEVWSNTALGLPAAAVRSWLSLAPASGKTNTLAHRVAHLLRQRAK
jgi:hypothetical protein